MQCPPSFVVSGSCGQRLGTIPRALLTNLTLNTLKLNSSTMNESCWQQCMDYPPTSNGSECVAANFSSEECVTFVGQALVSTTNTSQILGNTMLKDCFDSKCCFLSFYLFVCVFVRETPTHTERNKEIMCVREKEREKGLNRLLAMPVRVQTKQFLFCRWHQQQLQDPCVRGQKWQTTTCRRPMQPQINYLHSARFHHWCHDLWFLVREDIFDCR